MYSQSKCDSQLPKQLRDLLISVEPDAITTTLSKSQQSVLELVKNGKSALILGSAGCGKSTVIKEIYKEFNHSIFNPVAITSTTGISAYNIQGITLHSFMGFGTGEGSISLLLNRMRKRKAYERIRETKILVIDEISMMSAEMFEKLDKLLKLVRQSSLPFGGLQIVFSGDLLQLTPVFKVTEYNPDPDTRLIFESELFQRYFGKNNTFGNKVIVLTTNFRQQHDTEYQTILKNVRFNKTNENDILKLRDCLQKDAPNDIPFLVPTNNQASMINKRELSKISAPSVSYTASFVESGENAELIAMYLNELRSQFKQRGLDTFTLKRGCRVMLTRNLNTNTGLVNGALGTVVECTPKCVTVRFDNGEQKDITTESWSLGNGDIEVKASQLPLILAYSITIHKSQSLTLEKARIDLARCFTDHMVYVALSRVKSLAGLYLDSFDTDKITIDKKTVEYLNSVEHFNKD